MEFDKFDLIENAKLACQKSYSPYSNFAVGAALVGGTGCIYTGTNIENASYSLTVCAERVALFKAVSEGETEFSAIAIFNSKELPTPCGACLQVLSEFSEDMTVVLASDTREEVLTLTELLPYAFKL